MTHAARRALSALTTLAMLCALFVGAPAPVYAADPAVTYYVAQTGTPDGDGSSCTNPDFSGGDHNPITAASIAATDGDTIYICAGTYAIEDSINLGHKLLTLRGAGAGVTILDGGNTFNDDGISNNNGGVILESYRAMTVRGITFQNAYHDNNGSAIIVADVALQVLSSSFLNNIAVYGSAIYNGDDGTVTITDSRFTSNAASDSGGAVWTKTALVSDSTFTNNDAANNGGAIGTDYGNVTVSNSTFTGNTAGDNGGAIYATDTVTVTGSTFTDNSAFASGGAISATTVTLTNSTFTDNSADYGAGGAIAATTVTLTNSTFTDNSADYSGGGAISAATAATVTDSTFTGNDAFGGGAIYTNGTAAITSSAFTNNGFGNYGGAIMAFTATVSASTFTRNDSNFGGGIYADATAVITASTFTSNGAIYGGGIYAGTATIARSRFTRNTAGQHGGAVYVVQATAEDFPQLRRNIFAGNRAASGGAITLRSCDAIRRSQATRVERANRFSGNRATEQRRTKNIERREGGCG